MLGHLGRLLVVYVKSFGFVLFACGLTYLVISTPSYNNKPCVPLDAKRTNIEALCHSVFNRNKKATKFASQYSWCQRTDAVADDYYAKLLMNASSDCDSFRLRHGYLSHTISEEERNFPIAFSIIMHESVEQMERLLRLVYRPQNLYCIQTDAKSSAAVRQSINAIASCFSNVFIAPESIDIHWAEYSLLESELICLRELFGRPEPWYYYVNLVGRDFPLRTNHELVKIFTAYNGSNDVDGSFHRRPTAWTTYVWRNENWRTSQLKEKPPHNFLIAKGAAHVAVSRKFVDFALNDPRAIDLLRWMKDIRAPEEHFFPTLNHNPTHGVPGSYKGDPGLKWSYARMKVWQSETETCHGQWVRFVCNFGVGDIARIQSSKQLFFNKIRIEQDPVAFRCLELWYHDRVKSRAVDDDVFNLTFYSNLPFVQNHL